MLSAFGVLALFYLAHAQPEENNRMCVVDSVPGVDQSFTP